MSRIDAPAVRILRKWRNFDAGAIIRPPGSVRQILLEARDDAGKPVAEIVSPAASAPELAPELPELPAKKRRFGRH